MADQTHENEGEVFKKKGKNFFKIVIRLPFDFCQKEESLKKIY